MLDWAEKTLRKIAQKHQGTKQFRSTTSAKEKSMIRRLENQAYLPAGSLIELVQDHLENTELNVPFGFELRPADTANYQKIWQANEKVFANEPQRSLPSEASFQAFLDEPAMDPSLWSVIWYADQVAGVAFSEITDRNIGHITQLSVGENFRRQSLGRYLVLDSLQKLHNRGVKKVSVATDRDNQIALGLYQNCGFRQTNLFNRYYKSFD